VLDRENVLIKNGFLRVNQLSTVLNQNPAVRPGPYPMLPTNLPVSFDETAGSTNQKQFAMKIIQLYQELTMHLLTTPNNREFSSAAATRSLSLSCLLTASSD
jgi:hypothetical protein